MATNLFIIDKHSIVRDAIQALLINHNEINVVGTADNYYEHQTSISFSDVLLIEHDRELPAALSLMTDIYQQHPNIKVLLLSNRSESLVFLNKMLSAGVGGYVTKNIKRNELIYAIGHVKEAVYLSTDFMLDFLENCPGYLKGEHKALPPIQLSTAEMITLKLIAEGFTNTQMANELHISVRTVESRRKKLLEKTDTSNTATLIRRCLKEGLIS